MEGVILVVTVEVVCDRGLKKSQRQKERERKVEMCGKYFEILKRKIKQYSQGEEKNV